MALQPDFDSPDAISKNRCKSSDNHVKGHEVVIDVKPGDTGDEIGKARDAEKEILVGCEWSEDVAYVGCVHEPTHMVTNEFKHVSRVDGVIKSNSREFRVRGWVVSNFSILSQPKLSG